MSTASDVAGDCRCRLQVTSLAEEAQVSESASLTVQVQVCSQTLLATAADRA